MDIPDLLGPEAHQVILGKGDILDHRDRRDQLAIQEQMVLVEELVLLVAQDLRVYPDHVDFLETMDQLGPKDHQPVSVTT